MGRGSELKWMAAAAFSAACATSAITDDPGLSSDAQASIASSADASVADAAAAGEDPDAGVAAVSDALDASTPDDGDAGGGALDAGRSDAGSSPANKDAGQDAGRDAGRDASTTPDTGTPDSGVDAGPAACPNGTERCGSDCVDTSSESDHCGSCDTVCGASQVCTAGTCGDPAPTASNCTTKSYGGHNYLFCTGRSDDWVDARRQCINQKMDLGVPDDQGEQDFFKQNQAGKALWIGVDDRQTEGEFHAVKFGTASNDTGAQPSFHPWASGEPNNDKNCVILGILCTSDEDCAQLRAQDGLWNDSTCSNTNAYVCESY